MPDQPQPYFGLRGPALNRAIGLLGGCSFFLFGYDQGVMGSLLTLPSFIKAFPAMDNVSSDLSASQKSHNSTVQGAAVAIYEIGCMLGALSTLWVGDKLGRRKTIFVGAVIMILGTIIQTSAFSLVQFIIGRIVCGFGNGMLTSSVPVWQCECAKPEDRGRLVMIEGSLIAGGIMISYWIDFFFYFVPGEASFRFPIAFQAVFAIIVIMFVMRLPESPRWLIKKGREEEAMAVFAALDDLDPDDKEVLIQVEDIKSTLPVVESGALGDVFKMGKPKHFHRASLGFWIQCMQQITGCNLITFYAAVIYEQSIGLSSLNSKILAAATGTEYFLASFIGVYLIERLGRRKLLMFGAAGQAATMAILCVMTWLATSTDAIPHPGKGKSQAGIAAAVFLFVFNTIFGSSWLGIPWLYPAEIVSLRVRAPAAGLSTAANWIFNFTIVMITPVAFDSIGFYTYSVFAVINALMVPVVYFLYPETANRSLEEIDLIFEQANPKTPWDVVKIAQNMPLSGAEVMRRGSDIEAIEGMRSRQPFAEKEKIKSDIAHSENVPTSFD